MSLAFEIVSGQKNFPILVFINHNKHDRDVRTKWSLINTHCSSIRHQRHNIHVKRKPANRVEDAEISPSRKRDKVLSQVVEDTSIIGASMFISSNIGKLRVECIESYPSKHVPRLSSALEFYMCKMGPTGIWRPDILDAGAVDTFKRKFFQLSISTPAVTEIIMAIAQVHIQQFSPDGIDHSHFVLQHRGKALKGLRKALIDSRPQSMDTALVLMLSLLILDSNFEDWVSYETNLSGLRHFVRLRGGLECLGWHGWAAWMVMWAEMRWLGRLTQLAIIESTTCGLKPIIYPDHPFPRELCFDISKLPDGFTQLAISKYLSNDVIRHLREVSQWSQKFRSCIRASGDLKDFSIQEMQLANQTYTVLKTCRIKPLECLVCIGILTFIISFDANVPLERHPQYLKNYTLSMDRLVSELRTTEQTHEVLVWVATCVAAINGKIVEMPAEEQWFLLDRILDRHWGCGNFDTVWGGIWKSISMFFHDESLEVKWKNCWRARWDIRELAEMYSPT